jgi:hypothetical protein
MNSYTAKINAMTSTTDRINLEYYRSKYGIITGCLHAILGYQQKYAANEPSEAFEAVNQAQAWMQWADMLPREKWLNYNEARELPFKFYDLWKEYKASGTSETLMTWWENK